jgi:hypothetical protein
MDPAELDRWTVFDVEPTTEDWLNWAGDIVHPVVWNFINQNHTHLEHKDDYEPNKVYPSRRSWDRLSECLTAGNLLDEGADSGIVFNLTNSFVGFEAAVAFKDFVDNYERQVTVEDILDDGKVEMTADFGINEHAALITKMEQSGAFNDKLEEAQVQNLANYYVTLPSEVAMKLWTLLGQGHQANSVALHQSKTDDGRSVSAFIVELLTGEEAK